MRMQLMLSRVWASETGSRVTDEQFITNIVRLCKTGHRVSVLCCITYFLWKKNSMKSV